VPSDVHGLLIPSVAEIGRVQRNPEYGAVVSSRLSVVALSLSLAPGGRLSCTVPHMD